MSSLSPRPDVRKVRPETRLRIPAHVVYREFPVQTVILNLDTGRYHGLNATAGQMLAMLADGVTVAAAAVKVADRYSIPQARAEEDLVGLCTSLLERGLIEIVDGR